MTVTSTAGAAAGKTTITVEPAIGEGNSYKYKVAANPTIPTVGSICASGYTNWDGKADITAESGKKIVVVEVDGANACVGAGSATVVSAS